MACRKEAGIKLCAKQGPKHVDSVHMHLQADVARNLSTADEGSSRCAS